MAFDWSRDLFVKANVTVPSPLDLSKLEVGIEQAILDSRREDKHTRKTSFSPSSFGGPGPCARYWYYAFRGTVFESDNDALSVYAMEFGTNYGNVLESRLVKHGIASDNQLEILNENPPIKGYLDFIGVIDDENYVADLKTVGSDKFSKIKQSGMAPDAHILQVLLYMKILKYKYGVLVYINRDSGKMFLIPITISPINIEFINYVLNWMTETKRWADEESTPPARCFTKSTFTCKGCPVKNICYSEDNVKKTGPGKLEINITKWRDQNDEAV